MQTRLLIPIASLVMFVVILALIATLERYHTHGHGFAVELIQNIGRIVAFMSAIFFGAFGVVGLVQYFVDMEW